MEVAAEPKMETSGEMRSVRDSKQTAQAPAFCDGSVSPCRHLRAQISLKMKQGRRRKTQIRKAKPLKSL